MDQHTKQKGTKAINKLYKPKMYTYNYMYIYIIHTAKNVDIYMYIYIIHTGRDSTTDFATKANRKLGV